MPSASFRQDAAEVDGVELELVARMAAVVADEATTGGTGEVQREGLAMTSGPLGDDVGDDAAVVVRRSARARGRWPGRRRRGASRCLG